MALINTTTTGILGTTVYGDGAGALTVQKDGVTQGIYGNIPAFSVTQASGQAITSSTWTKLVLNTEQFDTNNNFDTSTYRFTPTVAGYYTISVTAGHGSSAYNVIAAIYKNGTAYQLATGAGASGAFDPVGCVTAIIHFNGSTDYVEGYMYTNTNATSYQVRLSGALVKAI